ncbi:MAG: DUF1501 domain-containing protein [Pirellulales bacterium]|nr:DUF1501 domain-containing protein [Pirellulales bacterium]
MLRVFGRGHAYCDRVSRRNFLSAGTLALGGLTLADLLRLQASAAEGTGGQPKRRAASVIYIEMAGGPSHFETYDPKPEAPAEYRGPLRSIATSLPGVRFCETLPRQAQLADRLAVIRSIRHDSSSHETSAHLTQTGYYLRDRQNRENEMPSAGSITALVHGANRPGVPAYVAIPRSMRAGTAAYLGPGFNPFETVADPGKPKFEVNNLSLVKGLSLQRLDDRRHLLTALDRSRRDVDALVDRKGHTAAVDQFSEQAFELVTGKRARQAFDIDREDPRSRDRYGRNSTGQSLLLARRLVEAGVAFVTVRVGGWDDHNDLAKKLRPRAADFDQAVAAILDDLYERGLDRQVMLVAMGEFGRTPRFNKNKGRDHWGSVMSVMMAGGGLKVGQIVGASNSKGEVPAESPYRPENVLATVYRHLGIDTGQTFNDLAGRPRYVLEERRVIEELI